MDLGQKTSNVRPGATPKGPGLAVRDLGRIDYEAAWRLQRELVDRRADGAIPDTVVVCEHAPVITVGRGARDAEGRGTATGPGGDAVPVVRVERGGQATFHGPGQVVVYPIVRLDRARLGLDGMLRALEEAVIRTCADAGIAGVRCPGATGVWIKPPIPIPESQRGNGVEGSLSVGGREGGEGMRKIASIGIAVRRWVTWHGVALNVDTDLRYFHLIRPCGFAPGVMTSMADVLGRPPDRSAVKRAFIGHLATLLAPGAGV